MRRFRRLTLFLLLNLLVSACATLGVLVLWDQTRGPLPKGILSNLVDRLRSPSPTPDLQAEGTALPDVPPTQACLPYQVQQGDTFESLAERYSLTVAELKSVNGFGEGQSLTTGDFLCVPLNPEGEVIIDSVIGAGDLETEHIRLKYQGEGELSLVGWWIDDGRGDIFKFPQFPRLILFGGGAVNVNTTSGSNTVVDVYWNLSKAVWTPGSTVTLRDPQGNIRATYLVP
jgi:hypothetical protein